MTDFDAVSYRSLLSGHTDEVLEIFDTFVEKQKKYPRDKKYLSMTPLELASSRAPVRIVHFVTDIATTNIGFDVKAIEIASGGKYYSLDLDDSDSSMRRFIDVFLTKHYTNFVTLCLGGRGGSFGTFIRQYHKPLSLHGVMVTPCSRPPTIDGISFSNAENNEWEIRDWNSSLDTQDIAFARIKSPCMSEHIGKETMLYLLAEATRISTYMKSQFGIRMRNTIGRTGVVAIRANSPQDFVKTRPDPLLRSMLDVGHGARAGMQWAIPSSGVGFKIDRNKSYPSEFRWALPIHSTFVVCDRVDYCGEGHFLCHVEGYSPRPLQIALWDAFQKKFIPIPFLSGSGYAVLQSVEFGVLKRLGVNVTPLFGYRIDQWEKYGAFDALFVAALHDAESDTLLRNYLKAISVAFVGSLARKPEYDDVIYSDDTPDGDWWPLMSNDGQVMKGWWVRTREGWSSSMQLDAAAWIWSCARESLMSTMCDLMDMNKWPVHAHTDSLICDGELPKALPIGEGIGEWKVEGEHRRYVINGTGWYDFEGERSRQSGVDRTWHDMVYDHDLIAENEKKYARLRNIEMTEEYITDHKWYKYNQPLEKCHPQTEAHKWAQLLYNHE